METRGAAETASTGGGVAVSRLEEALLRGDLSALRALAPEGDLSRLIFPDPDPKEVQHPRFPPQKRSLGLTHWFTPPPPTRPSFFLISSGSGLLVGTFPPPPDFFTASCAVCGSHSRVGTLTLRDSCPRSCTLSCARRVCFVCCVVLRVCVRACARRLSTWRAGREWWKRWPSSSSRARSTPTCPPRDGCVPSSPPATLSFSLSSVCACAHLSQRTYLRLTCVVVVVGECILHADTAACGVRVGSWRRCGAPAPARRTHRCPHRILHLALRSRNYSFFRSPFFFFCVGCSVWLTDGHLLSGCDPNVSATPLPHPHRLN
jgi:hypothetical protein